MDTKGSSGSGSGSGGGSSNGNAEASTATPASAAPTSIQTCANPTEIITIMGFALDATLRADRRVLAQWVMAWLFTTDHGTSMVEAHGESVVRRKLENHFFTKLPEQSVVGRLKQVVVTSFGVRDAFTCTLKASILFQLAVTHVIHGRIVLDRPRGVSEEEVAIVENILAMDAPVRITVGEESVRAVADAISLDVTATRATRGSSVPNVRAFVLCLPQDWTSELVNCIPLDCRA